MIKNDAYLLALQSINGLGPIRLKALLDYFQDSQLAWEAKSADLLGVGLPKNVVQLLEETRKKLNPPDYTDSIRKSGISWVTMYDDNYPKLLKEIYDPPIVLYFTGEILPDDAWAVAVVGTRKMTSYGKLVTEKITQGLVEAGVTVISGLARGVDTQAHKTTVEAKGRTIAVLGGGLKHIFPPENTALAQRISQGLGAVVSEFAPSMPCFPGNFPARNRIISGLSLGVVITEAAEDSGSLITAKLALEQGREVFAVPGPITSSLSQGPSVLIKQGARLVTDADEIIEELGISKVQSSKCKVQSDINLAENEKKILEILTNENKHIDEICRELNLAASIVSSGLVKMEILGLVKNLGGGNYIKVC